MGSPPCVETARRPWFGIRAILRGSCCELCVTAIAYWGLSEDAGGTWVVAQPIFQDGRARGCRAALALCLVTQVAGHQVTSGDPFLNTESDRMSIITGFQSVRTQAPKNPQSITRNPQNGFGTSVCDCSGRDGLKFGRLPPFMPTRRSKTKTPNHNPATQQLTTHNPKTHNLKTHAPTTQEPAPRFKRFPEPESVYAGPWFVSSQ